MKQVDGATVGTCKMDDADDDDDDAMDDNFQDGTRKLSHDEESASRHNNTNMTDRKQSKLSCFIIVG